MLDNRDQIYIVIFFSIWDEPHIEMELLNFGYYETMGMFLDESEAICTMQDNATHFVNRTECRYAMVCSCTIGEMDPCKWAIKVFEAEAYMVDVPLYDHTTQEVYYEKEERVRMVPLEVLDEQMERLKRSGFPFKSQTHAKKV